MSKRKNCNKMKNASAPWKSLWKAVKEVTLQKVEAVMWMASLRGYKECLKSNAWKIMRSLMIEWKSGNIFKNYRYIFKTHQNKWKEAIHELKKSSMKERQCQSFWIPALGSASLICHFLPNLLKSLTCVLMQFSVYLHCSIFG